MPQWNHTLDISDAWKKADNNEITTQELAARVFEKFKSLKLSPRYEGGLPKFEILERLEDVASDPNATKDDFDNVFEELYDFADDARIWVKIN